MKTKNWFGLAGAILFLAPAWLGAAPTEKIRNSKVQVVEQTLAPGESVSLPADAAKAVVYLDSGTVMVTPTGGIQRSQVVNRGDANLDPSMAGTLKNTGSANLRIVRIAYLEKGSSETWGTTGLSPNYKLLHEDKYSRVYDIKIPAGTSEPQHTHHDRVVICFSGAQLMHEMPDGRKENSTLKTDEIVWRLGGTHVGHNLGKTDLWVIVFEPK